MVNILASRMAGMRLAIIVGVILLPFLFVTSHLAKNLNEDISRSENERRGILYVSEVMPLLFAVTRGDSLASATKRFADVDGALQSALLLDEHHKELLGLLQAKNVDDAVIANKASKLIEVANLTSGVVLDSSADTYFFGQWATTATQSLLNAFHEFQGSLAKVESATSTDVSVLMKDQSTRNAWNSYAALSSLDSSLKGLRAIMRDSQHYVSGEDSKGILVADAKLSKPIAALNLAFKGDTDVPAVQRVLKDIKHEWLDAVETSWRFSVMQFSLRNDQQVGELRGRMNRTLSIVIGACFISLGTAYSMFRSSLRKLDDLSISRSSEERARVDAERTNERLSEINDDIVRLNRELADKMGKLKDAQDELVKRGRLEQLGQLTATVAHELRNPLGAVRTSAFLLERKIKDKGLGVDAQLMRINNGIARCDNIITQLLDFSRTKQITASAVDLDDWLEKVVEEEARKLPAAVAIDCHFGLQKREVQFDPSRLLRAIINLMTNASEALVGTGEDASRFSNQDPRLTISTVAFGNMVALTVADNGPGIPDELLTKIREPLFTTKSFGTGLGIPAVEQIAVQHGGRLEINSKSGEGAQFTILIPFEQHFEEAA